MSAVSSRPLSFTKFKEFIRSLDLSQEELVRRYNVMNKLVIDEIKTTNNQKVLKSLRKRRQFLADEAVRMIVSKEVA